MTQPTVCRMVHYTSYGSKDGRYDSTCRAAVVTEVHENYDPPSVGLAVLNPSGIFFDRNVRESDEHKPGTWHWPCTVVPTPNLGEPVIGSVPGPDNSAQEES